MLIEHCLRGENIASCKLHATTPIVSVSSISLFVVDVVLSIRERAL